MYSFTILIFFWFLVYICDFFLRTNYLTQSRYLSWSSKTGISFGFLKIKWFTSIFNKHFQIIGNASWFPWNLWFNLGVLSSLLALLFGSFFLFMLVFNTINQRVVEQEVLTPVIPGINVPFSEMGFIILSLVVAGVVHEVGHAIAAIKEGVRVDGFGLIFFILYPGAFTVINTGDLEALEPKRKLKIFSAGNWHNFVTLVTGLCLLKVLPILLLPGYCTGYGVTVSYLSQNSVLTGLLGLYPGDIVTKINNCPIKNQIDWLTCMDRIKHDTEYINSGYCMSQSRIRQLDISANFMTRTAWGNIDCCVNQTSSHLCFHYSNNFRFSNQLLLHGPRYACLPVRVVTEMMPCSPNSTCKSHGLKSDFTCVSPSLENSTSLIRIAHSKPAAVLFLGDINELIQTVAVSNYLPRWNFVSVNFPLYLETFLMYLVAISGALILFNSVPCYYLDGQWILQASVDMLLERFIPRRTSRRIICSVVTMLGTLLIFTNVAMSLFFMIRRTASA